MAALSKTPDLATQAREIVAARLYECAGCDAQVRLCDLNGDWLCEACGEPDEDQEDFEDTSPAAMLREHGTWRL